MPLIPRNFGHQGRFSHVSVAAGLTIQAVAQAIILILAGLVLLRKFYVVNPITIPKILVLHGFTTCTKMQ
jgi:hypothetical protein